MNTDYFRKAVICSCCKQPLLIRKSMHIAGKNYCQSCGETLLRLAKQPIGDRLLTNSVSIFFIVLGTFVLTYLGLIYWSSL